MTDTRPVVVRATVRQSVITASPVVVSTTIRAARIIPETSDIALAVLAAVPDLVTRFEESL